MAVFEAANEHLAKHCLMIEDGTVEPDERGCISLAIQNHGVVPAHLDEGEIIGHLEAAAIVLMTPPDAQYSGQEVRINSLHGKEEEECGETASDRLAEITKMLQLDSLRLKAEEKRQLVEVVEAFADVFAIHEGELGCTDVVRHTIDTGDYPPLRQPPRCIPFALREKVEEMVEEILEQGVIEPSKSPWASPIVLVAKKDGSTRFCVDYRMLNSVTKKDVYPLPHIDDILDSLASQRYFHDPRLGIRLLAGQDG